MKTLVTSIEGGLESGYRLVTNKGDVFAKKVVSSLPIEKTVQLIKEHPLVNKLNPFIDDNKSKLGGVTMATLVYINLPGNCHVSRYS